MTGRAIQKYNRYNSWWSKIEKLLLRLAILLFVLMYSAQVLNFIVEQRNSKLLTTNLDKLEGVAVADSQTQLNLGTIELTVTSNEDSSNVQIYVNGEYYKSFQKKSISLNVKNNDIIEISGIKNENPANIKITSVSDNVITPKVNSIIRVGNNFRQVGRIRLK